MEPDDRRERQRSRDREHEGGAFVTAPADHDDRDEQRQAESEPGHASELGRRAQVLKDDVRRIRVVAHRVLEMPQEIRIVREAGEADRGPREHRDGGTDRQRAQLQRRLDASHRARRREARGSS